MTNQEKMDLVLRDLDKSIKVLDKFLDEHPTACTEFTLIDLLDRLLDARDLAETVDVA